MTAYFTEEQPVKGKKAFQTEYKGVDWYFASQENLDKFKGDPEKYEPAVWRVLRLRGLPGVHR